MHINKNKTEKKKLSSERNGGRNGITDLEGKGSFSIKGLKKCEI